jgi:hypothetical protein
MGRGGEAVYITRLFNYTLVPCILEQAKPDLRWTGKTADHSSRRNLGFSRGVTFPTRAILPWNDGEQPQSAGLTACPGWQRVEWATSDPHIFDRA